MSGCTLLSSSTRIRRSSGLLALPSQIRQLLIKMPPKQQYSNATYSDADKQTISNGGSPQDVKKKPPAIPKPSASVLLISPQNHVLLLQRVKQSSSFPSAHVFPGGNVSPFHDGEMPAEGDRDRHRDGEVYRRAAVRETFEESGILLARNAGFGRLVEVPESEREEGRKAVHGDRVKFDDWLAKKGGRADLEALVPFTRWVTPANVPRRFTTQMYLYFLPTSADTPLAGAKDGEGGESAEDLEPEVRIPMPTTDGGLEHTTARFLPASAWLRLAQEGRIILFPPQFFLLHQLAQHFDGLDAPTAYSSISRKRLSREELEVRRKAVLDFVKKGDPPWTEMCISPTVLPARDGKKREDGRVVLGLERPGPELEREGSGRRGLKEQCVLVDFRKEGPRRLAVLERSEALAGGAKL